MKTITSSHRPTRLPTASRRGHSILGWIGRILLALLALVVGLAAIGAIYQAAATAVDQRTYPAPGQLADLDGYKLHISCRGV